jgi:membrane protein implicated in regulation of membrane protease activity
MNKRLIAALVAYLILGVIASFVLSGKILYAIWILFGYFATRAVIAAKAGWEIPKRDEDPEADSSLNQNDHQ